MKYIAVGALALITIWVVLSTIGWLAYAIGLIPEGQRNGDFLDGANIVMASGVIGVICYVVGAAFMRVIGKDGDQ